MPVARQRRAPAARRRPREATLDQAPGAGTPPGTSSRTTEVFFAGLIVQKAFVGLYFMPVYADADLSMAFGPESLATLKGKSCFHLKRLTPELAGQVRAALAAGYRLYEERSWV